MSSTSNKNDIQIHTPCKITIKYKDEIFYTMEYFSNQKHNIINFLESLDIQNVEFNTKNSKVLNATGTNNISLVYVNNFELAENTAFCFLNKKLFDNILEQTPLEERYTKTFMSLMFDKDNKEKQSPFFFEDDDTIIIPNNLLYYTTENTSIEDVIFMVIIRPDNYSELQKLYNEQNFLKLYENLSKQNFITLYHLTKEDVNKLERIQKKILEFYERFNIKNENVKIDVSSKESHNFWIHIQAHYRNIYETDYEYQRLTQTAKTTNLIYIIDHLKDNIILDNLSKQSFTCSNIKKFNLEECDNTCEYTETFKNIKLTYKSKKKQKIDFKKLIKDNKFHLNVNDIRRIIKSKISKLSSLCSQSICINKDGKYYVINIIPRTPAYIQYLFNNKNFPEFDEFLSSFKEKDKLIYPDTLIKYGQSDKLKYYIEIIWLDCYDCDGLKLSDVDCGLSDKFLKELLFSINRRFIFLLESDNIIANNYLDCLRENFTSRISFVIYNIFYSLFGIYHDNCYNIECKKGIKRILERLIRFENIFNEELIKIYKKYNYRYTIKEMYIYKELLSTILIKKGSYFSDEIDINILSDFFNNKGFIKCFGKEKPYIAIPGREYLLTQDRNKYKYLIWFVTPFIKNLKQIDETLDKILKLFASQLKMLDNKDYLQKKEGHLIENILINKDNFKEFYNIDVTNKNFPYIFNIMSLFNKDGSFNIYKYYLDDFIKDFAKNEKLDLYYPFIHYLTYPKFSALHVHIYLKNTVGSDRGDPKSLRNKISFGQYSSFSHELTRVLTPSYWSIDTEYYKNHKIVLSVDNIQMFIKEIPDDIRELIKKDILNNEEYNKLLEYYKRNLLKSFYDQIGACSLIVDQIYHKNFEYINNSIKNLMETYKS